MRDDCQRGAWESLYSEKGRVWRGSADLSWAPLRRGDRVLDAGCGNGKSAGALLDMGCEVVGADFSESAVARCRELLGDGAEFVCCDVRSLPFGDVSFDAALCVHLLGHLDAEGAAEAASEIARVVRPGGLVCGESFAPGDLRAESAEDFRGGIRYRYLREDDVRALFPGFEEAELRIVRTPTRFGGDRVRVRFVVKKPVRCREAFPLCGGSYGGNGEGIRPSGTSAGRTPLTQSYKLYDWIAKPTKCRISELRLQNVLLLRAHPKGMKEFIGRKAELAELERLYSRDGSSMFALFGRRRVGKTALLREFCRGKPNVFLTALGKTLALTGEGFSRDAEACTGRKAAIRDSFDLVGFLRTLDGSEKTVIVIDEYPLLADVDAAAGPVLQKYIDGDFQGQNAMLILCGSSIRAMREHLNDGGAPLFKRFPAQMMLDPMPYREARLFHPGLSEEDRVRMYAIASGVPLYHDMLSGQTPREAVERLFLSGTGALRREAENIVSVELSPWETYDRVLAAIRDGKADVPKIRDAARVSDALCRRMLKNLELVGAVRGEAPFGCERGKAYSISDGFLRFYYEVVVDSVSEPDADPGDVYDALKEKIDTFYGRRFEEICRQYVTSTRRCVSVGSWWGKVPVTEDGKAVVGDDGKAATEDVDVDIAALVRDGAHTDLLLGECKFTRRKVGEGELRTLMERGDAVRGGRDNKEYVLFSRSGFAPGLAELAEDYPEKRVELVDMDRFARWAEGEQEAGNGEPVLGARRQLRASASSKNQPSSRRKSFYRLEGNPTNSSKASD